MQSVERVIGLLGALGLAGRPLSARELAAEVRLPRPTVYRLMHTLSSHGLVLPTAEGFVIGPRILTLAAQRLEQIELRAVGRRWLRDLRDRTGETVHLAVLEQGQVVYVDKVESPGPLRMASAVGKIVPAHCTALGKAMLAYEPHDTVRRALDMHGMPRRTPNTITDLRRLFDDLAVVRARGFAIDNVENEDGIRCVAAAIFDHEGRVSGAVSVSGAASSVTLDRARRDLGPRVRRVAQQISREMGWRDSRGREEA
ncbi:MAG: IclR family transcriptional regulator [Armatimonadota bacterium]|nr:IclR family transcriptional regulator [Armatimonadota bacterium]